MTKNYNDENPFRSEPKDLEKNLNGFIKIPIQIGKNDDGQLFLYEEYMLEEFHRVVSGMGIVIDEIQGTDFH